MRKISFCIHVTYWKFIYEKKSLSSPSFLCCFLLLGLLFLLLLVGKILFTLHTHTQRPSCLLRIFLFVFHFFFSLFFANIYWCGIIFIYLSIFLPSSLLATNRFFFLLSLSLLLLISFTFCLILHDE